MAEGARLESVYRGNSIGGSNPPFSAIYCFLFYQISLITCTSIFGYNLTLEKGINLNDKKNFIIVREFHIRLYISLFFNLFKLDTFN